MADLALVIEHIEAVLVSVARATSLGAAEGEGHRVTSTSRRTAELFGFLIFNHASLRPDW